MPQGTLSELDTLLEVAKRLDYVSLKDWTALDAPMERNDKVLSGLLRRQKEIRRRPSAAR